MHSGRRILEPAWQAEGFPTKLKDRVALVTGAASGIARATAQRFAREGAKVVVADGSLPGGLETVKLIQADGGSASFTQVDVSQAEQVNRLVEDNAQPARPNRRTFQWCRHPLLRHGAGNGGGGMEPHAFD